MVPISAGIVQENPKWLLFCLQIQSFLEQINTEIWCFTTHLSFVCGNSHLSPSPLCVTHTPKRLKSPARRAQKCQFTTIMSQQHLTASCPLLTLQQTVDAKLTWPSCEGAGPIEPWNQALWASLSYCIQSEAAVLPMTVSMTTNSSHGSTHNLVRLGMRNFSWTPQSCVVGEV